MSAHRTMRDALLDTLYRDMKEHDGLFLLSADLGAPLLDPIRRDFSDRFINVGIAEQNMINVATGLAMEGYTVFTMAIATFYLRALEQIRNHLAMSATIRPVNVTMLAIGAGVSYNLSGPSHHCLEDIGIMRSLPNVTVVSPSDWVSAQQVLALARETPGARYVRLDGQKLPPLHAEDAPPRLLDGFCELRRGRGLCIIATGHMVHLALRVVNKLGDRVQPGVIDLHILSDHLDPPRLLAALAPYETLVTLEEGFIGKGGVDQMINDLVSIYLPGKQLISLGFTGQYSFTSGSRDHLYDLNQCGEEALSAVLTGC